MNVHATVVVELPLPRLEPEYSSLRLSERPGAGPGPGT
jgi:hypothetical protein